MKARLCLALVLALCIAVLPHQSFAGSTKLNKRRIASGPALTPEQRSLLLSRSSKAEEASETAAATTTAFPKSSTKALIEVTRALARSHSASEVLTLNLTNLLILIVLKAVIFGIGLFYFGGVSFKGGYNHDNHHGWSGRSLTEKNTSFMSENELLLMLTYLLGSATDNYECMYRVACEDPVHAKTYLNASKMMMKGAKYAKKYVSVDPKYEHIVGGLQQAIQVKQKGGICRKRYACSDIPDL